MSLSPRVIALLGFGEAGSAIARGLCAEGGWRGTPQPGDNAPRRVIAIDTALDKDARGTALGKEAQRLDVAIEGGYTAALRDADLVICAVQGEHALEAAEAAAPLLKKGAHYLDLCTVTGKHVGRGSRADRGGGRPLHRHRRHGRLLQVGHQGADAGGRRGCRTGRRLDERQRLRGQGAGPQAGQRLVGQDGAQRAASRASRRWASRPMSPPSARASSRK